MWLALGSVIFGGALGIPMSSLTSRSLSAPHAISMGAALTCAGSAIAVSVFRISEPATKPRAAFYAMLGALIAAAALFSNHLFYGW